MATVVCPRCRGRVRLPDDVMPATIRCPWCVHSFWPDQTIRPAPPPVSREEASAPQPTGPPTSKVAPALTSPHRCQHCHEPIRTSTSRQRATVVCPACTHKTSVYAVVYFCGSCGLLLESPSRQQGLEVACPGCGRRTLVPRDVLHQKSPEPEDDSWFGIDCPNCLGELVANKADVGAWTVCLHCLVPLSVPNWGHYLKGTPPVRPHGPLDAVHCSTEVRCQKCDNPIPTQCAVCPWCGSPNQNVADR